ncbi:NosD domain-containing protein, partial [Nanoarchaeota archaeon]
NQVTTRSSKCIDFDDNSGSVDYTRIYGNALKTIYDHTILLYSYGPGTRVYNNVINGSGSTSSHDAIYVRADGALIYNNTITNIIGNGIELFRYADNCVIENNTIFSVSQYGIRIREDSITQFPDHINISSNIINQSGVAGIYLGSYINNCTIYNNYFNNSVNYEVQATTGTNFWNTSRKLGTNIIGGAYLGGNFWNNYAGTDSNSDGIGETDYLLDSNNIDYLPLTNEVTPNSLPTQLRPILNSTFGTNLTTENLTVYNVSTYDPDGHPVKNIINWYRDNLSITLLHMPFENNGTNAGTDDYSGHSNNGQENSGVIWNSSGGYDGLGAYEFDGAGDYIYVPNILNDQTIRNRTLVARFKPNGPNGWDSFQGIVSITGFSGTDDQNPQLEITLNESADGVECLSGLNGGSQRSAAIPVPLGEYSFAACTQTYNGSDSVVRLYVNGVLRNTTTKTDTQYTYTTRAIRIGLQKTFFNRWFEGAIDEVMIFNHSLSPEQIKALYENKTNLIVSQETSVGENWSACITPNDGYDDGDTNCSNNVTILQDTVGCGDTITEDTNLTENLICIGNAITIGANGVTLDCEGNNLIGDGNGRGIFSQDYNYTTINNCKIYNFSDGVYVNNSYNIDISSNEISNNTNYGVYFRNSSNDIISNNEIKLNTRSGIRFATIPIDNITISYNNITNNGNDGIETNQNFSNSRIYNNNISNNNWGGISVSYYFKNNRIYNNILSSNELNQIDMSFYSENVSIYNNIIKDGVSGGIFANDYSSYLKIYNNTIINNAWEGMFLDVYSNHTEI